MDNQRSHPLLAQVPLTVSPFVSLPTATTLPYTYKTLPSSLPASLTEPAVSSVDSASNQDSKPKFVVSSSGHAAHPDDIIASCQSLQAHLKKLQADADQTIKDWEGDIRERELAEKRRVAPGYLDREEKILEPRRATSHAVGSSESLVGIGTKDDDKTKNPASSNDAAGEELDRVFGSMKVT